MKTRRPTKYDQGQHELICKALKVSEHSDAPGDSAYEAVCTVMMKLDMATNFIRTLKSRESKRLLRQLRKKQFVFIKLYGTEV